MWVCSSLLGFSACSVIVCDAVRDVVVAVVVAGVGCESTLAGDVGAILWVSLRSD